MRTKTLAFAAALTLALSVSSVLAQYGRTAQGTWTAGGAAFYDADSHFEYDLKLTLTVGTYIEDGWMVGGYGNFTDNKWFNQSAAGATTKWHFWDFGWYSEADRRNVMPFSAYLGADLGFGYVKTAADSNFAIELGARIGLDFFFTDYAAFGLSLNARVATDDIYTCKKGLTNTDLYVIYGVMFCW